LIPSAAKAITCLLGVASAVSKLDVINSNPKNELISPWARALTVLKSELFTSVKFN